MVESRLFARSYASASPTVAQSWQFAGMPSTFAPATDVPVPTDYIIGPGDTLQVQMIGSTKGRYALVRTGGKSRDPDERGQPQWLLLKKPDEHSRVGEQEIVERQPHSVLSGLTISEIGKKAELVAELLE